MRFPQAEAFSLNVPYFLLRSLHLMVHSAQESQQVLVTITHHGLVQLLVMNAIRQILILWELFRDSTEE
jgi:hypothetical protein